MRNNPLQASLDCGACGGQLRRTECRLAALLLNQPYIRHNLRERGIDILDATRFLAGLHNTTLDEVSVARYPAASNIHFTRLASIAVTTESACRLAATERISAEEQPADINLMRMACEWSEVRPEWGLAGNAAFIAAPRHLTRGLDLDGRCFLHNYHHEQDK